MYIGIIGGSGLNSMQGQKAAESNLVKTPFGDPSAPIQRVEINATKVCFLPRHGTAHQIPPHQINYRANIWALREQGVKAILATAAVGAISAEITPPKLVLPEQLIDYTYGREHTFFGGAGGKVRHIDFTDPYSQELIGLIQAIASKRKIDIHSGGTYAATQGPRLETAAEIDRLQRDGADIVGMTGMPEAALARELAIPYACIGIAINMAAGRGRQRVISEEEMQTHLSQGIRNLIILLNEVVPELNQQLAN